MSRRCLVFGSSGFLGNILVSFLKSSGFEVISAARSGNPDIQVGRICASNVAEILQSSQPDFVINVAAATNVDKCERDVSYAVDGNINVICAISDSLIGLRKHDVHLIHISTDQVYAGTGDHCEDAVSPINVYGLSKLAGELSIRYPLTTILRTNFVGKSTAVGRKSFTDWIVESLAANNPITLYSDVRFNPVHTSYLCSMIVKLMGLRLVGTFNLAASSGISKADFALRFAGLLNLRTDSVVIGSIAAYPLVAKRPLDMTMSPNKLIAKIGGVAPNIYEEILKTAKDYENEKH
jgi:dTDP-4-dehydrorhamnose reductase